MWQKIRFHCLSKFLVNLFWAVVVLLYFFGGGCVRCRLGEHLKVDVKAGKLTKTFWFGNGCLNIRSGSLHGVERCGGDYE